MLKEAAQAYGGTSQRRASSLRLPAELASVSLARCAVNARLREQRMAPGQLRLIALAVSEAVDNAVRHAYGDGVAGEIELELELELRTHPAYLHVRVRDWGCGGAETASAGLGMTVMRGLSEEFELRERWPLGTEVLMSFPLSWRAGRRPNIGPEIESALARWWESRHERDGGHLLL
jgi:anti-sigma regulatory factor (Ser/Thr protein kinase)